MHWEEANYPLLYMISEEKLLEEFAIRAETISGQVPNKVNILKIVHKTHPNMHNSKC